MRRREAMKMAAAGAGMLALRGAAAASAQIPILDAHIHLFDPMRPGGVPWPEKTDTALYKPALPERYMALAAPFGVVGAIAIEASPIEGDNGWLLDVARRNPVVVGVVGDLVPGSATYAENLERLHRDPLFLGIRYGNLWNRDLAVDMEKPGFMDGLKALAQAQLVLESANPDPSLIRAILRVSERVPELRIVIDHLPRSPVPKDPQLRLAYESDLHQLAQNSRVYVKLSEIPVIESGTLITDVRHYQADLDALWEIFGEDHVVFGSDWPNSDHVASYAQTMGIARSYIAKKSAAAREKYFWRNSLAVYRWRKRMAGQPA